MNTDAPMAYMDKDGNSALNKALERKSEEEKSLLKSILDLAIHTEFQNGRPCYVKNDNMSKEELICKLQVQLKEQRKEESSNISGLVDVMENFIKFLKLEI